MMYKNDMVCVVKNNGKILREQGNTVLLPFSAEYSLLLKNLRSKKAVISISIDGQDVLNGNKIIIDGNKELELERFLEDMDKGNRFKFIAKTEKIQEYRGDKVDDGIIRIEFQYEREIIQYGIPICTTTNWNSRGFEPSYGPSCGSPLRSKGFSSNVGDSTIAISSSVSYNSEAHEGMAVCDSVNYIDPQSLSFKPLNDEGITVKGSVSNQKFTTGYIEELESEKHVITLQLKGETSNGIPVATPVTVKSKKICTTCGTKNEISFKYCKECGTYLN